jgi:hypothetical protein
MAEQPLGELWISLRPIEEELKDVGGNHLNYQQEIILELIEQFGFN